MATVHKTQEFDVSADEMWALIGDFHGMHKWVEGIEPSESLEDGALRKVRVGTALIVERLLEEGDRSYTYAVEEGPISVTDYRSTLCVIDKGDAKCVVDWRAEFEPAVGTDEQTAVMVVDMMYSAGLQGMAKRLSGSR